MQRVIKASLEFKKLDPSGKVSFGNAVILALTNAVVDLFPNLGPLPTLLK
jgi:hypothetical protein